MKRAYIVFAIVFVDILGFAFTIPILPLFAQDTLGGTPAQITSLTAIYFLMQSISAPYLGYLSDRFGRRAILIISQFGTLSALILSGLAPALYFIYIARIIDGISGGNISIAKALLSDISTPETRAKNLGMINTALDLGLIIGPAIGGILSAQFGMRIPFFVGAAASLATIILSYFFLPHSDSSNAQKPAKDMRTVKESPSPMAWRLILGFPLSLLFLISFIDRIAFYIYIPTWILWLQEVVLYQQNAEYVQQLAGWLLTLVGVAGVCTQLFLIGVLVERFGEKRVAILGASCNTIGWTLLLLFPTESAVVVGVIIIGIGAGLISPTLTALITFATDSQKFGYTIGLLQTFRSVGRFAGAIIGGMIFQWWFPSSTMLVTAILGFIVIIGLLWLPKTHS